MDPVSSIVGSDDIEIRFSILVDRLDDYMEENFGERTAKGEINEYLQAILSGQISKKTILHHNTERLLSKELSIKKESSITLTFIYTATTQYLIKSDLTDNAWAALAEAKQYFAYYAGLVDPINHKRTERAEKGGRQKAQNAAELETITMTLLSKRRPRKGWRNAYDAAHDIASELSTMANERNISTPTNIEDLIHKLTTLILENKEVARVFESPQV